MNCKKCNAPISENETICSACGAATENSDIPTAIDALLDDAYTAATEQSDFESNTPLTEVYQGSPDSTLSLQEYALRRPSKTKKTIVTVLVCLLVCALTLTALSYFQIISVPILSDWFAPEQSPAQPKKQEPLFEAPTLSDFSATTTNIAVGETTEVLFTLRVDNPSDTDMSGLAVFYGEMQICLLNDNGENGDPAAGDGFYSARVPLKSDIPQAAPLYARLGLYQSGTLEMQFHLESPEDTVKAEAFLQSVNNITDYNQAKTFIQNSNEIKGTAVFNDNNQTIEYETIYGFSHSWPHKDAFLVVNEPQL